MLVNEAYGLATILDRLAPKAILDIGSGSRPEREITQPWIAAVFRGHNVTWTDYGESPGVLRCDICDRHSLHGLPWCEMVTCFSVLEHVEDIDTAIDNLRLLVRKWIVVSVPAVYPKHDIPIDNMWRPTPSELAERVAGDELNVVEAYLTMPERFGDVSDARASIIVARRK